MLEAMKQALEALEKIIMGGDPRWADDVIPTLRQAIREHAMYAVQRLGQEIEQEPVAWMFQHDETGRMTFVESQQLERGWEKENPRYKKIGPVYTHPPQRIEPVAFLANAMRFKLSFDSEGKVNCFWNQKELDGRWVALVAAEDDCHLKLTHPPQLEQNFCPRCGKRTNDIHTCTPSQRTWVGLTEQEQGAIMEDINAYGAKLYSFADAIEAKLKEKNT